MQNGYTGEPINISELPVASGTKRVLVKKNEVGLHKKELGEYSGFARKLDERRGKRQLRAPYQNLVA